MRINPGTAAGLIIGTRTVTAVAGSVGATASNIAIDKQYNKKKHHSKKSKIKHKLSKITASVSCVIVSDAINDVAYKCIKTLVK